MTITEIDLGVEGWEHIDLDPDGITAGQCIGEYSDECNSEAMCDIDVTDWGDGSYIVYLSGTDVDMTDHLTAVARYNVDLAIERARYDH